MGEGRWSGYRTWMHTRVCDGDGISTAPACGPTSMRIDARAASRPPTEPTEPPEAHHQAKGRKQPPTYPLSLRP